ncbi:MAG: hypothetical protein IT303_10480 [Dehalococcoidia bacterium]|nr:hypothetical protein [Dehalococcoidia bacterium]
MTLDAGSMRWGRVWLGVAVAGAGAVFAVGCDDDDDLGTGPIQTEIASEEAHGGTSNQSDEGDRTQIPGQGAGTGGGVLDPAEGSATPGIGTPTRVTEGSDQQEVSPDDGRAISDLTAGFQGHVYLVGELLEATVAQDSARVDAAQSAVNANTQFLATAVDVISEEDIAFTFTDRWQQHIAMYEQYVAATLAGDGAEAEGVREDLEAWAADFAALMADSVRGEGADAADIQEVMELHVRHTLDVADAIIAKDPQAVAMSREGAQTMADFAKMVSGITE